MCLFGVCLRLLLLAACRRGVSLLLIACTIQAKHCVKKDWRSADRNGHLLPCFFEIQSETSVAHLPLKNRSLRYVLSASPCRSEICGRHRALGLPCLPVAADPAAAAAVGSAGELPPDYQGGGQKGLAFGGRLCWWRPRRSKRPPLSLGGGALVSPWFVLRRPSGPLALAAGAAGAILS